MSDALLETQKNANYFLNVKRFGVLMVSIVFISSILLPYKIILAVTTVILAAITIFYPQLWQPIYWVLTPPLSMGLKILLVIFFYTILTPLAFLVRILGMDIIHRNIQPEVKSYWVNRTTLIPHGKYLKNQR